jgi:ribosome-binding protein aMBF1 (putative translation factor)
LIIRIREILDYQGRQQKWLSEQIGVSYIVMRNYCRNIEQPDEEMLCKIAAVLGVGVQELTDGKSNRSYSEEKEREKTLQNSVTKNRKRKRGRLSGKNNRTPGKTWEKIDYTFPFERNFTF